MRTHQVLLVAVLAVAIVPAVASGDEIVSYTVGTGMVGGLTEGVPGAPVSLDFTAHPQINPPAQLVQITFAFQSSGIAFDQLKIQLDAGPDIYSFDSLNGQQVAHFFTNPDQLWKDELSDGVLNCHVWVEGVTLGVPDEFMFSASGSFLVPEPATLGLLGIGGLTLLMRRRKR